MSKGGGGSNTTKLGDWSDGLQGPWTGLINRSIGDSELPYHNYFNDTGQSRVAGINPDQLEAMDYTRGMARSSSSPIGAMDGARGGIEDTLGGQYLGQSPGGLGANGSETFNPWSHDPSFRNPYGGYENRYNDQVNPYAGQQTQVGQNQMLQQPFQNPYADKANEFTGLGGNSNPYSGQQINTGGQYQGTPLSGGGQYQGSPLASGGMFSAQRTDPGTNQFQGMDNPYFRQQMQTGMEDITAAYERGTAADTRARMNKAGIFGGGAHQEAVNANEQGLAKQLGNYANQRQSQQYDRSAGMDESRLGRAFQGQQFDTGVGQQSFENAANRGMQAGQFNEAQGMQGFENAAQRGLQAGQFNGSQGMQSFENAAQRGMQGQQFGMGLGSQNYENALNRGFQGQESQYGRGYGSNEADVARRFGGTEAGIDRSLQAGQFDSNLGANAYESMLGRSSGNMENQLNRGFQGFESLLNRGDAGWQAAANRGFQGYQGERDRMMQGIGLGQNEQNLAYQRIGGMMGIGDFNRGVQQQQGDELYNNWYDQNNYNRNQDAWLAGILSGAQGGLPPSQMNSQSNGLMNGLGTALAAYGMFRS